MLHTTDQKHNPKFDKKHNKQYNNDIYFFTTHMTQKKQSKDTQNIINTYKVIYKTFFVFGNIIIATVASVGIRLFVQAKDNTIQISTNTKKTEEKSIETPIDTTDITIYKEQNSAIKNDINILYSDRNIIQYK